MTTWSAPRPSRHPLASPFGPSARSADTRLQRSSTGAGEHILVVKLPEPVPDSVARK